MPLTIVWIVAVMNMVNFLDGLDGLAAGVCGIAGITFSVLALSLGKADAAILSAIVAGACIGFLRHNFFPARIFMGDSGALVLGFTLATVSVAGLLKTASTVVLFLPLLVLAVPIIDTSFVVAKRLKYGRPIYSADRSHLHHRFLNIGFSQRRAALAMWGWTATLGAAALATTLHPVPRGRRVAPVGDARRRRDRARRARLLGVHRLPARDRQAREPARAAARSRAERARRSGAARDDRTAGGTVTFVFTDIEGLDGAAQDASARSTPRSSPDAPVDRPRGARDRVAGSRSTPRATRSSSRSRAHRRGCRERSRRSVGLAAHPWPDGYSFGCA